MSKDILQYFKKHKKIEIGVINIFKLKPFILTKKEKEMLKNTQKKIIICDNDYADGLPSILASKINVISNCKIEIMGLPNKTAGHHTKKDVLPPNSSEIIKKIKKILL